MPRKAAEAAAPKTTATKKTTTRRPKKTEPTILRWEDIATHAYYLSLDSVGDELENWLRAERELALQ
jgi:hypothetical protein